MFPWQYLSLFQKYTNFSQYCLLSTGTLYMPSTTHKMFALNCDGDQHLSRISKCKQSIINSSFVMPKMSIICI